MHVDSTCWTVIGSAAEGSEADREQFAQRYATLVRSYLVARWQRSALQAYVDDACQEVFMECFREGGVLKSADPERPGGFRAFFYGVIRNVARRYEDRRAKEMVQVNPGTNVLADVESDEETLSRAFDRAWVTGILREAAELQAEQAKEQGAEMQQHVELLRMRFYEGLPIRDIAERWNVDPVKMHREYAKARKEFKDCLLEVIKFHEPTTAQEAERRCAALLEMLG